jgi:hypothetical protein
MGQPAGNLLTKGEITMQYGLFMIPMHPPEKPLAQAFDEDIDVLVRADALGYHEAGIGEHFTSA